MRIFGGHKRYFNAAWWNYLKFSVKCDAAFPLLAALSLLKLHKIFEECGMNQSLELRVTVIGNTLPK